MATSQMVRPEEKTGTWASMFPVEQVTEQQSALFAKKLLAVAISNITYLRAIFPERAYGDRCLGDLNLKILRDDSSYPGASQVVKWVKGCFDALDKKYLRMLIIGIYVDVEDPQTVIESYTFKFSYSTQCGVDIYRNGKKISSAHSTENTKKETIQLLRTIIVLTQTLQPLPDNVMMTMKILYYDEVTPADYEPPGFKASDFDAFQFHDEPVNIKLGDVETPFHSVKMRIKTDKKQFDFKDDAPEDITLGQTISNSGLDNEPEGESQKANDKKAQKPAEKNNKDSSVPLKEGDIPLVSPAKPEPSKEAAPATPNTPKEDDFSVRCACGCNEDDGLMIVCDVCNCWQHAVCYRILDEEHAPEEHTCDTCVREDKTKRATDPYLKELNTFQVQATCLWRRSLQACTEFNRLQPNQLAQRLGVDNSVAQGLIKRLEKEGFVLAPNRDKRLGKVVDKEKVQKVGIPAYFKQPQKTLKGEKDARLNQDEKMDVSKTDNKSAAEEKEKRDNRASNKDASNEASDLSAVTEKAANISLQSHQLRSSVKRKQGLSILKDKPEKEQNTQSSDKGSDETRGQKRAFSRVDQTEFSVCGSQETHDTRSSRRRKCSDVHKSIRV
ncbi:HORMA domain-containing protein 1-like isoform X2 [Littorina saxatilis]|uniref:HORMA domain-containing protein n=1 Tax=Littorina saxatilis TaxID=31220 RepID=A0AAN9B8G4_9CAEN